MNKQKFAWKRRWRCANCRKLTSDDYMLKDKVWLSIAQKKDKLCLACVEKRLGRNLKKSDFSKAPVNYIFGYLPMEEAPDTRDMRAALRFMRSVGWEPS
jgi:hypothetical protein